MNICPKSHLILIINLEVWYDYYLHFTGEEIEA